MITENELKISNDSATKKDFYQIYPEILEMVSKISSRWNPSTSNESDPGVVLLKLLAFVADKNNYNIDKNVLELFLPSLTQEESLRKITEMMGYTPKYYNSATTEVSFMYKGDALPENETFILPRFSVVSNSEDDIEYITLKAITFDGSNKTFKTSAIEGTLCDVMSGSDSVVTLNHIDANNRFYLPESMIAENGIFIKNISDDDEDDWVKVTNLNTQPVSNRVWKFGFDSQKGVPYIEFPSDIANIINDGLSIKYVRTNGVNGNIDVKVLNKLVSNTTVETKNKTIIDLTNNTTTNLVIVNQSASTNGSNKDSINKAYKDFKKTVGTFDTLVTCRDYANAIYNLVDGEHTNNTLVSNVQVGDVRDDINMANNIITLEPSGVINKQFINTKNNIPEENLKPFDISNLIMYPFIPTNEIYTTATFNNSFKPDASNFNIINSLIERDFKTIAHNLVIAQDLTASGTLTSQGLDNSFSNSFSYMPYYAIKNLYNLNAKITTTYKVNPVEETEIRNKVFVELYKNFNSREVEYGERIPFDILLETIQNADPRIKNVSLEEPVLETAVMFADGSEVNITNPADDEEITKARGVYLDLLSKNILAGRVPLLKYDTSFNFAFGQTQSENEDYKDVVFGGGTTEEKQITEVFTETKITLTTENTENNPVELLDNEFIQFRAPSFSTKLTYGGYVNYHLVLANKETVISANSIYKLQAGDALYVRYTNSNDKLINITYKTNKEEQSVVITNGVTKEVKHNLIQPNFELKDSSKASITNSYTTKQTEEIIINGDSVAGLFSLKPNQTIEIKDFTQTVLDEPTNCYWVLNTESQTINTKGERLGDLSVLFGSDLEYTLKDGEYFFYTDSAMDELVTLGSGTKLKVSNPDVLNNAVINYTTNGVDLDVVASRGLGAFADVNWKYLQLSEEKTLTIQEMRFITLVKDNKISTIELKTPEYDEGGEDVQVIIEIGNKWEEIKTATYIIDGEPTPLDSLPGDVNWEVRSRLDLNSGPSLTQTLKDSRQTIIFKNSQNTSLLHLVGDSDSPVSFRTNYVVQEMGENKISVEIFKYSFAEDIANQINDFKVSVFNNSSVKVNNDVEGTVAESIVVTGSKNTFTPIGLNNIKKIELPFILPKDTTGIFAVYYNQNSSIEDLKIEFDDTLLDVRFYNGEKLASGNSLTPGINVLQLAKKVGSATGSYTITLKQTPKSKSSALDDQNSGTILFNGLAIIPSENNGIDIERLGIEADEVTSLLGIISDKAQQFPTVTGEVKKDVFLYNFPENKEILIDYDNISDPISLYDYNNVLNNHTISQLNTRSFRNITLTKGSKA